MMENRGLRIFLCLIVLTSIVMSSSEVKAAVCAFRNPDRDLYMLFPDATGYRTVFKELNDSNRDEIETATGQLLDLNDIGTHTLYVVLKEDEPIGFIHAHSEWGTYGAVELIFGYNLDGTIKDFFVQRSREKNTKAIKSEDFRRQFRGKKPGDPLTIGNSKNINPDFIKPPEGAEKEASVVAFTARKIFIFNELLFGEAIEDARKEKTAPKVGE